MLFGLFWSPPPHPVSGGRVGSEMCAQEKDEDFFQAQLALGVSQVLAASWAAS